MANSPVNPNSDSEWVTVSEDELNETKWNFEILGESLTGEYLGSRTLDNRDGAYTQYRFRVGEDIYFINGNYSLSRGMGNVRTGSLCRITYVTDKDTGQATPMRIFTVEVARRRPVKPQTAPATTNS